MSAFATRAGVRSRVKKPCLSYPRKMDAAPALKPGGAKALKRALRMRARDSPKAFLIIGTKKNAHNQQVSQWHKCASFGFERVTLYRQSPYTANRHDSLCKTPMINCCTPAVQCSTATIGPQIETQKHPMKKKYRALSTIQAKSVIRHSPPIHTS